jgi:hypothetical protein
VLQAREVEDGVQFLAAITKVPLARSPPSQIDGDERMENSDTGRTPAAMCGGSGALKRKTSR